jgi:oligopeptide/dipeptide ABC transporter ATP-binding protein
MNEPIIELQNVSKRFVRNPDLAEKLARYLRIPIGATITHALDGINLSVSEGEVVGLVGESGCGKSTLGRIVAGIMPTTEGEVHFRGSPVEDLQGEEAAAYTLQVQMIFQDPFSSLSPRMRAREIIGNAPLFHGIVTKQEVDEYVDDLMLQVGLEPSSKYRLPHQFSGGQRQRIGIARALAVKPKFLVCDEAVAALDVSIQAQVLHLFIKLRDELELTYLFISHDLSVVEHLSDRVVVMYLGRIVESASTEILFARPNHPYTKALLEEIPRINTRRQVYTRLSGEIPSPLSPPSGCHFHTRCPKVYNRCKEEPPELRELERGHFSACHLNE